MGQQVASECYCHDGFMQLCVPEDPNSESQNTFKNDGQAPSGYPNAFSSAASNLPMLSERDAGGPLQNVATMNMVQQGAGFDLNSLQQEERAFVAPPPQGGGFDSPLRAAPKPPSPSGAPAARSSASPARRDVTDDDVLSNLEGAEEALYGEAFSMFPGGRNGVVGLDSAAMRDFLCTSSCISMEDIDIELLKVAAPDEGLTRDAFLHMLREFPVSEGDAIFQFLGLSSDGESLVSEECRTGLLLFAQQKLSSNFSEERWECILNTVMWDASVSVSMEQWLSYCKLTGRIVRLLRYKQVQKLAGGSRSAAKGGVVGGA